MRKKAGESRRVGPRFAKMAWDSWERNTSLEATAGMTRVRPMGFISWFTTSFTPVLLLPGPWSGPFTRNLFHVSTSSLSFEKASKINASQPSLMPSDHQLEPVFADSCSVTLFCATMQHWHTLPGCCPPHLANAKSEVS